MKVRIKELAQEAKFIRFEQNKIKSKQKIVNEKTSYKILIKIRVFFGVNTPY
jgi:hypothetical protein